MAGDASEIDVTKLLVADAATFDAMTSEELIATLFAPLADALRALAAFGYYDAPK